MKALMILTSVVLLFFSIFKNTLYPKSEKKEEADIVEILRPEERQCYCFSYYKKEDKKKEVQFTCDHKILGQHHTLEIFMQVVSCTWLDHHKNQNNLH